jgi:hypothetical protein
MIQNSTTAFFRASSSLTLAKKLNQGLPEWAQREIKEYSRIKRKEELISGSPVKIFEQKNGKPLTEKVYHPKLIDNFNFTLSWHKKCNLLICVYEP